MRDTTSTFTQWDVQNSHSISFWYDKWAPIGRLIDITGIRGPRELGIPTNSTLRQTVDTHHRVRRYRTYALTWIQLALQQIILKVFSEPDDILLWRHGSDRYQNSFSSRLTWNQIRNPSPLVSWSKAIWFKYAIPKYVFLSWIAVKDRLSTLDQMEIWSPGISTTCVLCSKSSDHLYFSCDYASRIWFTMVSGLLGINYTTCWTTLLQMLNNDSMEWESILLLRLVFQSIVYHIWRERNCRRHGEPRKEAPRMTRTIDKSMRNRISSIRSVGDHNFDDAMVKWFGARILL